MVGCSNLFVDSCKSKEMELRVYFSCGLFLSLSIRKDRLPCGTACPPPLFEGNTQVLTGKAAMRQGSSAVAYRGILYRYLHFHQPRISRIIPDRPGKINRFMLLHRKLGFPKFKLLSRNRAYNIFRFHLLPVRSSAGRRGCRCGSFYRV